MFSLTVRCCKFLFGFSVSLFPDFFFFCALSVDSVGAKPEQHNFFPSGEPFEDRAERQQAGE